MQWLTVAAYALPELFGLGIALALLMTSARQGRGRKTGMIGIVLMLGAALAGLGVSILQTLWILNADGDLQDTLAWLTVVRVTLNVVSMAGLVTVVWGLCRASHETNPS
jgi:apolipoprotein N-acyltransferase